MAVEIIITKETIKEFYAKVENVFKDKTANWKPKHWFIAGVLIISVFYAIFPIISLIGDATSYILGAFLYEFTIFLGMDENRAWTLIEIVYENRDIFTDPYIFTDYSTYLTDLIAAIILSVGETGRKAWEIVIDYFPVLLDFQLDFDFVNIDFVKILRSVFSVLQFVIIFILMRKFRIYLRKVIKRRINDFDSFDKQFFQEVRM